MRPLTAQHCGAIIIDTIGGFVTSIAYLFPAIPGYNIVEKFKQIFICQLLFTLPVWPITSPTTGYALLVLKFLTLPLKKEQKEYPQIFCQPNPPWNMFTK